MQDALLAVGAITLMAGLVYVVGRAAHARTREHVLCPVKSVEVTVDFERRLDATWSPAEATDVVRCTALPDPAVITCSRKCMRVETGSAREARA